MQGSFKISVSVNIEGICENGYGICFFSVKVNHFDLHAENCCEDLIKMSHTKMSHTKMSLFMVQMLTDPADILDTKRSADWSFFSKARKKNIDHSLKVFSFPS